MTFICSRLLATAAIMAMMLTSPVLSSGQTRSQQPYYSQQDYYRWYYQQYQQQYQQHYQQRQQDAGLRRMLPAYRGYQTNQMQQAAPWSGPAVTARPAAPQSAQQPAQYAPRKSTAERRNVAPAKTAEKRVAEPAPAARRTDKPAPKPQSSTAWLTSFEAACEQAQQQGKPIVVLFVHEGCPECDRMDQNLALPGARETLACAVKVRIEFTENPAIVNRFGVSLTPTFLVLSPSGVEAYREVGALTVDRLRQIQPALENLVVTPADSGADDVIS